MDFRQQQTILNSAIVGYEIEGYASMSPKQVASQLGKAIGKKIIVPKTQINLDDYRKVHHSDDEVTDTLFKLEPDYSLGQRSAFELITGPMGYAESRVVLIKILDWLRKNGWTTDRAALHMNISFDTRSPLARTPLVNLDPLKFCLAFDEDVIYNEFPKRKNSVYAASIKQIYPTNKFAASNNLTSINRNQFIVPSTKYYGVNFSKLAKGYLEFRYIGGAGYERKTKGILSILEYSILTMYEVLTNPEYTSQDIGKIRKIMEEHQKVVDSFSDPESFFYNYRDLSVLVDLKGDIQTLKSYWTTIREKLFDLIVLNGLRKGMLGYDKDVSVYQLKDAKLTKAFLISDMEIIDSKITGNIERCDLHHCTITNSQIRECRLMPGTGNVVKRSKIIDSPIYVGNDIIDSYVDNHINIINGKLTNCILRSGEPGNLADIDASSERVDPEIKGGDKDETKMTYGNPVDGKKQN